MIFGIPLGLAFLAVRRVLPGSMRAKGLLYGLVLFVVFMLIPFLRLDPNEAAQGEFGLVPPVVALALFAPLPFSYGLAVAATVARLERSRSPALHTGATAETMLRATGEGGMAEMLIVK
jgi:hypothetical protein